MRSTLKLIRAFLFVTFSGISLVFATAGPAVAQSDILRRLRSGSSFNLDREKSDKFDLIVGAGPVNPHVKVIDGSGAGAPGGHVKVFDGRTGAGGPSGHVKAFSAETMQMLRPAENVVITYTISNVSVKFDSSAALTSPRNGQPVKWTRGDGAKWELTSWLRDGALIQVLTSSSETITRNFTLSEDGKTLTMKVEVSGAKAGEVKCYLVYKLDRGF